jgi:hypothetical protein
LAAGVFASLAASQLMPTFHEARGLREATKRPILGMVSMLPSQALHRSRKLKAWLFASGIGGLVAAFSAILALTLMTARAA